MLDKGRLSSAVNDVPVYAVMVENLGERGAHRTAFSDYEEVHASIGLRHSDSLRHHQISETTGSGATACLDCGGWTAAFAAGATSAEANCFCGAAA